MMIRWEQQPDGNWQGFSGEVAVATVTRDDEEAERWLWTITALKRPKGWRKGAGHRTLVRCPECGRRVFGTAGSSPRRSGRTSKP
jgi:hypothetical protein